MPKERTIKITKQKQNEVCIGGPKRDSNVSEESPVFPGYSAYGYSEAEFAQIRRDSMRRLAELCEQGKKDRSLSRKPRRSEYKVITKEVRALRILRKRRGISQCEASRLCGYIPRRFSHLEAGHARIRQSKSRNSCFNLLRQRS